MMASRHGYGDPAEEYRAAREHAIVVNRSDRGVVRLYGRDPVRMIQGLVTSDISGAPPDRAVYSALLTPKGKLLAELRAFRREADVLLETDRAALDNVQADLRKYVPPLFARHEDVSEVWGMLGIYGPAARTVVGTLLGGPPAADLPEDGLEVRSAGAAGDVLLLRTLYAGGDGYDLLAPAGSLDELLQGAVTAGARPAGLAVLEILRIEAGRPRWGAELDETVIPLEVESLRRAISTTKGCYTGQEVIVRILHRGHVNRQLRGVLLEDAAARTGSEPAAPPSDAGMARPSRDPEEPLPAPGTELLDPATGRSVGRITSVCVSPRLGRPIGLAFVRREVEPAARLAVGTQAGARATVVALPFDADVSRAPGSVPASPQQ